MKQHTQIYLEALGYHITDFMPCELTNGQGVDIHHIVNRENRIENLMLLTRELHSRYGEIKHAMVFLLKAHRNFLQSNDVEFDNTWFETNINKYIIYENRNKTFKR